MKTLVLILLAFVVTGCATPSIQKQYVKDINAVIENAVMYKEPCSFTCGKLKDLYYNYQSKVTAR